MLRGSVPDPSSTMDSDERRYRKLIENIHDTVTVVDATGRTIWTSAVANGDLGYVPNFWNHADLFSLVHPDDRPDIEGRLSRLLAATTVRSTGEVRLRNPDGRYTHVAYSAVNRLDDGDIGGIVITARPIDAEIEERTKQAERRQELEKALADRSQWVAGLSHELRSPLHAIIGLTELVRGSAALDRANQRLVETISEEASALRVMIDSLLDYSKIGANRMELVTEPFSPAVVLDAVRESHLRAATAKGLRLRVDIDAALPLAVLGDEFRFRQIIVNLLTNAIKYTEVGYVDVAARRLRTSDRNDEMVSLMFAVSDTGPGIPAEAFDTLFEPYRQVRTADAQQGTGLGLSITKSLVELMGGSLNFESSPEGTTFTCEIPFQRARRMADVAGRPVEKGRSATGALSVLVVDDSEANRVLARSQLERLGHQATVAVGGREAIDRLERESFDVVLMDWHMPEVDGLEATRRIRAAEIEEHVIIIATTASARSGDRELCLAAGTDDYLAKPIALADLSAMLERWSGERAIGQEVERPERLVESSAIDQLCADLGDVSLVAVVISTFLDELEPRLQNMSAAAPAGDVEVIRREAHTIKSTAAMFGAVELAAVCDSLETLCKNQEVDIEELTQATSETIMTASLAKRELSAHRDRLLTAAI